MPQITGINEVKRKLQKLAKKSEKDDNIAVIVGYTASYALWVHEAVEMKLKGLPRGGPNNLNSKGKPKQGFYWDPQGQAQAKFLETPAREHKSTIASIAVAAKKRGATMLQSLLMAGLYLQRMSMLLVPVDTGNLKGSAFTREDDEL